MSHLFGPIASGFEEVSAFGDGEEADDVTESIGDCIEASCGSLSQECLEFRECHFDWVQVWRIGRQEEQPCAFRLDQMFRPFAFVEADIIKDDDIAGRQCWHKLCLNPCFEDAAVHRSVDDPWRGQAMAAQSGNEGLRLPFPERSIGGKATAFG